MHILHVLYSFKTEYNNNSVLYLDLKVGNIGHYTIQYITFNKVHKTAQMDIIMDQILQDITTIHIMDIKVEIKSNLYK
jgi:hypothetical protein